MDTFLTTKPLTSTAPQALPETKEDQGRAAWKEITKAGPATEESFLAWYCATHNKKAVKRPALSETNVTSSAAPTAKKQALMPGASAAATSTLSKGKRTALLKSVGQSLKASVKAKKTKWHAGDRDVQNGTAVMDPSEFAALFSGTSAVMTKKGVTTTFSLNENDTKSMFGDLKISTPTWSRTRPGSFQKAYKTGSESVSVLSAEGKYSTGTSTLTLKFSVRVEGGYGSCGMYGLFGADY